MAGELYPWNAWRARSPALFASALSALTCISAGAVAAFFVIGNQLEIEFSVGVAATMILALIYALVLIGLPAHDHPRFGYANGVTAVRAAMVAYTGAAVFFAGRFGSDAFVTWTIVGLVAIALLLDGLDGYLARHFRQESGFGARFDMEVDALLIMILSIAVLLLDKAGVWVLLIGLMRYLFVVAARFEPRLNGRLFPSFRRKSVCVVQGVALCVVMAPVLSVPLSGWIAAFALAGLSYSFAVDIHYLLRNGRND